MKIPTDSSLLIPMKNTIVILILYLYSLKINLKTILVIQPIFNIINENQNNQDKILFSIEEKT